MVTQIIAEYAVKILNTTGYAGATGLMALESMIFPVPSEAVMPFVGFLVADGKWNFWLAVAAASAGSILGSLASYVMGYYGGRPFVLKVGRYLLLNVHDLEKTEAFFHRNSGTFMLFVSRFIPVVRHFISIPAGTGKMPMLPFLAATFIGATLWNTFLLVCGMKLRENWELVERYSKQVDYVVVLLLVIGFVWWLRKRRAEQRGTQGTTQS